MLTEYADGNKTRFDTFDSWSDFYIQASEGKSDMEHSRRSGHKEGGHYTKQWSGTDTYAEALQLAQAGWKAGVKKAHAMSSEIENRLYSVIQYQTLRYDVTGDVLDVARFCTGEPEHWGVWQSQLVEGPGMKHVHIVVNCVCSGGIDVGTLIQRGSAISALVNLLELSGQRVKLDLVMADAQGGYHYELRVPVKQYDETLDLDRVVYAVANPSTFRRHCFSLLEQLPEEFRQALGIGGFYGKCQETLRERGDIYMPMMELGDARFENGDTACRWVQEELTRLGVIKKEEDI